MPKLTLTDFVDLLTRDGASKASKIREIKTRGEYGPEKDFYRYLRESIVKVHSEGLPRSAIRDALEKSDHPPKLRHYPEVIEGYLKWWGRKELKWFEPPRSDWVDGRFRVSVGPELGLRVNGKPHVIKLHFKGQELSKRRVDAIHHLMRRELEIGEGVTPGVLDIRRGNLIVPTVEKQDMDAILAGEMAYIKAIWTAV